MGQLKYKGYSGSVEYSEEDNCLFGKVLGLRKDCITYEGETISELKSDFEGAIDDYFASCKDRGVEPAKPYSGKLIVRMPSDLRGINISIPRYPIDYFSPIGIGIYHFTYIWLIVKFDY